MARTQQQLQEAQEKTDTVTGTCQKLSDELSACSKEVSQLEKQLEVGTAVNELA